MADSRFDIGVYSDGSLTIGESSSDLLARQPHDTELVDFNSNRELIGRQYRGDGVGGGPVRATVVNNNVGMPEVYRLYPMQSFWMTDAWKRLVIDMNPKLPMDKALAPYYKGVFLCNTQDFLCDQLRWCGGAYAEVLGIRDDMAYLKSLQYNGPIPSVAYMDDHPELWYYGTTIIPNGVNRYVTRKGYDGGYYPIRIPFISRLPVAVPISWLDKLSVKPPDSFWKPQ